MSTKERVRLDVFSRVKRNELTVVKAGELLGLSERQARRVYKQYRLEGDAGLVHGLRGRPGNARKTALREKALALCRQRYDDFGSALAAEYLARAGVEVARQTLWRWRRESGDLGPTRRVPRHRSRRERRGCMGELLQMDGSTHDWFEGRGPVCVLFVTVDDASGRLFCRFYESEDTASAFDLFGRYARKYGLPMALYVDKDSIYRVNDPQARDHGRQKGRMPQTQFGRAMEQLGVQIICADSPQAKGRVERANGTLQDRLVKALRLAGISTIQEANAYLQREFLPAHNRRFARKPAQSADVHRAVPGGVVLADVLCVQEARVVGRDWCVRYENRVLQLSKRHEKLSLVGRRVTVLKLASGRLQVVYKGRRLRWQEFGACPCQPASAKPVAAVAATSPPQREPWRPAPDHPWRGPSSLLRSGRTSLRSSSLHSAGLTGGGGDTSIVT